MLYFDWLDMPLQKNFEWKFHFDVFQPFSFYLTCSLKSKDYKIPWIEEPTFNQLAKT